MRDMMGDGQARRGTRAIRNIATIALAIVMLALVSSALLTGPSLDDYWTLYLSDPTVDPTGSAPVVWVHDPDPQLKLPRAPLEVEYVTRWPPPACAAPTV